MQVQEAVVGAGRMESMPELATNIASLQLATNRFQTAEQQYTSIIRRFFHGASPRVLLYLARTQYHNNQAPAAALHASLAAVLEAVRQVKAAAELRSVAATTRVLTAKSTLLKALHQSPGNHILRFDAALALQVGAVSQTAERCPQEAGQRILGNMDFKAQAGELRRLEDYDEAYTSILLALRNFEALQQIPTAVAALSNALARGVERLQMHVSFCKQMQQKADTMRKQASEREAAREAREAQNRAALQAAQRRVQLEAERKAAQEAAATAERETRAEEAAQRLAALKGQWAEHAALQQHARTGRRAHINFVAPFSPKLFWWVPFTIGWQVTTMLHVCTKASSMTHVVKRCVQAADAGDAERLGKARKKKKRKAEEEAFLASDDDDDVAYEGDGAQADAPPQQEEPETHEGANNNDQAQRRKAYAGTGVGMRSFSASLSSSDEEEEEEQAGPAAEAGQGADQQQEAPGAGARSTPGGGRLRKRLRADTEQEQMQDINAGEEPDVMVGWEDDGDADATREFQAKRAHAVLFDESDED
ncbi:hypothetical protein MMC29_000009 [Sticta canariensis]|nr:hypothetical protein [Sticta canariensis]